MIQLSCPKLLLAGLFLCFLWAGNDNQRVQAAFLSPRQSVSRQQFATHSPSLSSSNLQAGLNRENEIRRKIADLKRDGKLKNQPSVPQDDGTRKSATPVAEQYGTKLRNKLGAKKAKLLGTTVAGEIDDDEDEALLAELDQDDDEEITTTTGRREARLGALPREVDEEEIGSSNYAPPSASDSSSTDDFKNFDASLFEDDNDEEEELSEEELVEMVAEKLAEKRRREQKAKEAKASENAKRRLAELQKEQLEANNQGSSSGKTTTGIGGRWMKEDNVTASADYKPSKSGTWGVFERPKDISKTFGGGKRVGAGYTPDNLNKKKAEEATRDRLKQYREKVGIDVQSEKDHAEEIDQALAIGRRAMERGIYGTAASALEKVTKWCSTNSVVGGKVFLELAMAYEAVGRTQEAITVYTTLSKSRIEETKYNAKRLLYGIEAMQFMRDEARSPEFSRKKIRNTFIDTTGLANIAQNFDDVYNTAYIDLDSGYYRRLTESVVRSNREARQILLKATGAGEVPRLKIVQALRSISRHFDDALEQEIEMNKPAPEPVAWMDGKPLVVEPEKDDMALIMTGMDEFALASAEQMKENMAGAWRLQLLADKRGDGVKYYNTSYSWQELDTESMTFTSSGVAGFLTVEQSGGIEFQEKRRILTRTDLVVSGTGGVLSGFLAKSSGASGAVSTPHQVVSVDSVLMITRMAATKNKRLDDSTKEYFAVWRRIEEPGGSGEAAP
ncbi:expressed unknown protein [Seminavis robusta]|uniref:Uncharacterized protein n=1 Tax=Seminavis robusta TaxID=568900 RepID=A0A9N8DDQ1_9STRA|nr:expressed unknown protein [Seminavis robusta]|eukprot:Sro25_g017370.1 n/a (730) ;mRNA; f:167493-169797